MAGDRGDDLAGVQRTKRNGVNGTPVSSSSGPRSRTREGYKARDPRARERERERERAAYVNSADTTDLAWLVCNSPTSQQRGHALFAFEIDPTLCRYKRCDHRNDEAPNGIPVLTLTLVCLNWHSASDVEATAPQTH